MGGRTSVERSRDEARKQRDVALNEMNATRNTYNTTVNNETNRDNTNIYNNRQDVINTEKMKAEAKLIEVRNLAKNKMVDTINKLNTGFNDHLKRKNIFLEEQNSSLKSTFQKLLGKTNDELDNLMKNVTEQNKQLEAQIEENRAVENHSKTIKSNFLKIEFDKLKYQNTILWYAFYVVLLILAFVMFFFTKFSFAFQIIVFILLLFYPFLIYYTELLLYILYSYSLAFFNSTKFESVYLGKY
jgi:hypothetical protein